MSGRTLVGLVTAAILAGCASSSHPERTAHPLFGELLEAQDREPKTPALHHLKRGKNYIVLIDIYDDVKKLSKLVGFSGDYGHIEVVRDGYSYGCRPPQCSEISLTSLEQKFDGHKFEVREVPIDGGPELAIRWFKENLEGQPYDLFYRNCTDAVVMMYDASGDRTARLSSVDVNQTYATNAPLRRFMSKYGIPKPNRTGVFFPDQFATMGELVAKGRFMGQ